MPELSTLGAVIKPTYEGQPDTNAFTDAEKQKLEGIAAGADVSPVSSVNGQTGAVSLTADDVGALPDSYTPPAAPVQSVNGQTGAVSLDATDIGASPVGGGTATDVQGILEELSVRIAALEP